MTGPLRRGQAWALLLGALGLALVVAGIVVVLVTGSEPTVTHGGSYERAGCLPWPDCVSGGPGWSAVLTAGTVAGLGTAVLGGLLLAAVAGWLLGSDSRADQR